MKKLLYSLVIVTSFLIIQCSNEIPNSVEQINLELGKVSLRIDKENAPANVVLVEAYLTRAEYDTLYGALNILSTTSADILFDEVAAGDWHLKVDAKDDNGVVLYSGETEMTVQAGILTQVNLVLNPTGNGTGAIYIYVTWGQNYTTWTDYIENPILSNLNSDYDYFGIAQPNIIKDENIYKMWFVGMVASGVKYVMYSESVDGKNWTRSYPGPVLSPGPRGTWDSWAVHPGAIIKDGNVYKMYYSGWADQYGEWHVGLATSLDGIVWEKNNEPVLLGGTINGYQIVATCVIKVDSIYYMYYSSRSNSTNWRINVATSYDGINWNKYSGNPVLISTGMWEGSGIYHPSVILDEGIFKMVYMNTASNAFGMATSTDGINWTKAYNNPFFTEDQTANNWADEDIAYPFFMKIGNEYRIYYSGIGTPGSIEYRIGFMRKFGN